jgi:TolB-like protein/DNA-binding winged helix-turn-helix (wHTH) protein
MAEARPSTSTIVRFGIFEVDLRAGELRRNGLKVKLQEQPFQILAMLVERPGEIVTREEIQQNLWPEDTFVDFEHSINAAVKRLREALDDSADNPRFVETLHRRGYRFIAPVVGADGVQTVVGATRGVAQGEAAPRPYKILALAVGIVAAALAVLLVLNVGGLRDRVVAIVGAGLRPTPGQVADLPLPPIRSIAVLPLENLSHDPEQEYFADGMTEALITDLGQISALRVISRTSVMQYKGTKKPLPQIARELNVDAIVEGTVLRSGDRVRITANLLDARSERHLWAESYDRDLRDVLALQDEVARAIASKIQIKVTPNEQVRLASPRAVNPEAYRLYLIGRFLWNERTEASFKSAIDYFQRAIEIDPGYAPAYAGLADSYVLLSDWGYMPAKEVVPRAEAAAQKAVDIDESLAEAHTSLANAYYEYDWDWAACAKEFQRAIELNPNYATAHQWYGEYLARMGRYNEAIGENEKAQELDPLSPQIGVSVASRFYEARRYDEAIRQMQSVLPLFLEFPIAYQFLGDFYEAKGSYEEAITAWEKAMVLGGTRAYLAHPMTARPQDVAAPRHAYAKGGIRGYYLWALEGLKEDSKSRYVRPYLFARLYARLGESNQTTAWLERAYQERDFYLTCLRHDPAFDPLRSDPRFQDLMRRMNFPPLEQ